MSMNDSLAVKYRPKKLDDVIGQPVVVKAFKNAFKSKTLHHAYILAGKYGCGKTTVARIIAAMENCEKGGKDPCGECDNCRAILSGKSIEVIELDAASHGGVDDIRAIHKELYQMPIYCKTKYVIIDEAHSLTKQSAEASLKMIEEPPEFVRFILCTTEPQSFKPTIHSRCITWKFNSVSWLEMIPLLEKICGEEKIVFDRESLTIIAKASKGSVRNSLQNLQTVMNYTGERELTEKDCREALGVIDSKLYSDLIDGIIEVKIMNCYKVIENMLKDGKDIGLIVDGIYEYLNNILMVRACKKDLTHFHFNDSEIKKYSSQAEKMKGDMVLRTMNLMNNLAFGVEYSLNPQVLLNKFATEAMLSNKRNMPQ